MTPAVGDAVATIIGGLAGGFVLGIVFAVVFFVALIVDIRRRDEDGQRPLVVAVIALGLSGAAVLSGLVVAVSGLIGLVHALTA